MSSKTRTILKPLYPGQKITVGPTKGTRTIAEAKDVFTAGIDSDYEHWGTNKPSGPTDERALSILEMQEDANFADMFGSLANGDIRALILSQDEILDFVEKHRDKMRQDGYATFALFEADTPKGKEIFVANLGLFDGGPHAYVHRFDYSDVWRAVFRHRVVVPQLS